ncbi:hypothetical protein AYO21_07722 [Fonsecaea monophora]|uniref:Tetraspanin Tsp3 n=1 Tax=Fonsecaea monophora TaxID=254056 RepID=A0A177F3D8_9EURO|nr:hypothetical protein AYO21_07722 [Fonsecaea monophora]OAG38000.1 hypothetical protein AYO21_07722 [Fonsecaea monophora]
MAIAARARKRTLTFVAPYLRYFLPFLPFALFILSLIYAVPSDLLSCSIESQWVSLFRAKNEDAVRGIENALRCCGFNSLHDRAWPFPSHDVDVTACERTLGYTRRCVDPWRNQEQVAAGLLALASLFNWILLVTCEVLQYDMWLLTPSDVPASRGCGSAAESIQAISCRF